MSSSSSRYRPRRILLLLVASLVAIAIAGVGFVAVMYERAHVDTAGDVAFTTPLRVPPLAQSHRDAQGRRVFDLELRRGETELRKGTRTATYGVNGDYLGPTIRARRGERVLVNVRNALGEPSTVHWHGMHLPAAMDGGPHQPIADGETWSPTWRIDQPAATLWYHPHPHGDTADQVYRGLAGMVILDDPENAPRGLPDSYGVDDFPVVVQDKRLDEDGTLDASTATIAPTGIVGDEIVVNGTPGPYLDVGAERVRLRLLNASNARPYDIGFADDREFELVGTDGGLLARPQRMTRIALTPGERAEIVVTLEAGERAVLRSFPNDLGMNFFDRRFTGADDTLDLLELRAADRLRSSPPLPETLAELPPARAPADGAADATVTRTFELSSPRAINGESMEMERIDFATEQDRSEVWEVHNNHALFHNFHVHDVQFRVLDVDGAPPPPELSGLKDTVAFPPDARMRLLVSFSDYADRNLPYMFHCHLLEHEDRGMMGQFVVVEPGDQPGTPANAHQHAE